MEISIRRLLDNMEDSSVPMEEPDVVSLTRIKELTKMKLEQSNTKPRHRMRKRLVTFALAAALVLALSAAAYAVSGRGGFTATRSMPRTGEYTSLSELPKVERVVGYPLIIPESFANGYRFSRLRVDGMADYDENRTVLRDYYTVNAVYTKPGAADLLLCVSPAPEFSAETGQAPGEEIRRIGETDVSFRLDSYKFVPEDYEKTADDSAREASGRFFLSYGADEIAETAVASVGFDLGNVNYTLLDMAANEQSLETLGELAGEIIAVGRG